MEEDVPSVAGPSGYQRQTSSRIGRSESARKPKMQSVKNSSLLTQRSYSYEDSVQVDLQRKALRTGSERVRKPKILSVKTAAKVIQDGCIDPASSGLQRTPSRAESAKERETRNPLVQPAAPFVQDSYEDSTSSGFEDKSVSSTVDVQESAHHTVIETMDDEKQAVIDQFTMQVEDQSSLMYSTTLQEPYGVVTIEDWSILISQYIQEDSWMHPVPWEKTFRFEPKDYQVELLIDNKNEPNFNLEHLFDPVRSGGLSAQRVLITAHSGCGKSTLCLKTVHDWTHCKTTFRVLPWNTTLPILVKLRLLDPQTYLEDSLYEFIQSSCSRERTAEDLKRFLRRLGSSLLLILDGYDELDSDRQTQLRNCIKSWQFRDSVFCAASLLVTSRPTMDSDFISLFQRRVTLGRISKDNVEYMVKMFSRHNVSTPETVLTKKEKLSVLLASYPATRFIEKRISKQTGKRFKLASMPPLIISLVCWIINQPSFSFKRKDVIYSCVHLLAKRCNEKERFDFEEDEITHTLWRLGVLCLRLSIPVVTESELRRIFKSEYLFLCMTGIVKKSRVNAEGEPLWEPFHKSFFDCLAHRVLIVASSASLRKRQLGTFLKGDSRPQAEGCSITFHYDRTKCKTSKCVITYEENRTLVIKGCESFSTMTFTKKEEKCSSTWSIKLEYVTYNFPSIHSLYQDFPAVPWVGKYHEVIEVLGYREDSWLSEVSFQFLDFDEACVDEIVNPSALPSLWHMRIYARGGEQYRNITYHVMFRLFGISSNEVPHSDHPGLYLADALSCIKRMKYLMCEIVVCVRRFDSYFSYAVSRKTYSKYKWDDIETIFIKHN